MGKFIESKTAKNLLISYSAETQARTRYDFFANKAREDGYIHISRLFSETANQEYEHALRFFKFFNGGDLEISWNFPAGVIKDTCTNLLASADLERYVNTSMYPVFAEIALEEDFQRAADTWLAINNAEEEHEIMFRELADTITRETIFSKATEKKWKCLSCGYIHSGNTPPDKCPACVKPAGYFELYCKNWK